MLRNCQVFLYNQRTGTCKNGDGDEIRKRSREEIAKGNKKPFESFKRGNQHDLFNSVELAWPR